MEPRVFSGLLVIWVVTSLVSVVVHFGVVCRRLYRAGARPPVGLLPWRWLHDMHRYKELLRANSDSLSPYYIFILLAVFNVALGAALLVWHLQRLYNPYG
jgi:hypothetical protein